jgi:hypothetical protein
LRQAKFPLTTITINPERRWRTRVDPFRKVWKQIRRQLQKNPSLEAKTLFKALQRQHPGRFPDGQLRTLQRRVSYWRATEGSGKKILVSGRPVWTAITDVQLKNPHQRAFLSAFEVTGCVKWSARVAEIARKTHYCWLESDPKYAVAFKEARVVAADFLESKLVERATVGWLEPVYYQGKVCGHVRRFDSSAAKFLLRAWMPEKYGNQISVPRVAAPVQPPPKMELAFVHPEEDAARKKPPVGSEALPGTQGFQNVQYQGSGTAAGVRPEAADAVRDPHTVLCGNSRNAEPAQTGRSVSGRVPPQPLPPPQDLPKSDEEIIALARRFLKSADATANLPKDRDHSRIVALPPERPYSKCAWT